MRGLRGRTKYPPGIHDGMRVRLTQVLRNKGGEVFLVGDIMLVGGSMRARRGRHGHPRVSLWDPKRSCYNAETGEAARGIVGVERDCYEPIGDQ